MSRKVYTYGDILDAFYGKNYDDIIALLEAINDGVDWADVNNKSSVTCCGNTYNAANKLVQLDSSAKLPAVDGSQLTNLPANGWNSITGKPTFATVATSGSYNDLTNKPASGGKIIQRVFTTFSGAYSTTATIPYDNSIPQNTEGTELGTLSITPTSTSNYLRVQAVFPIVGPTIGCVAICALFKDSISNAKQVTQFYSLDANNALSSGLTLDWIEQCSSTSAQTWKIRYGAGVTGTCYLNRAGNVANFLVGTGLPTITFIIEEFSL